MTSKVRDITLYISCYITSFSYGGVYVLLEYTQDVLGGTASVFGQFLAVSGIITILFVGFSGRLAKAIKANIVAGVGSLLCGSGMFGLALIDEIGFLYYLSAALIGLGWSFYYAASPMIVLGSSISEKNRGKYISMISACVVLGTSSLPILYNLGSQWVELNSLFLFAGVASGLAALGFYYLGALFKLSASKSNLNLFRINLNIWKTEALYPFLMVFFGACVFSTMMAFQTAYAEERNLSYAVFFACYSSAVILSRVLFGGLLSKKNPINNLTKILYIMICGLGLMIINDGNTVVYALSSILIGISYGLAYPLIKTYAIKVSKEEDRHQVLAFFTLSYFSGVYFFPLVASHLLNNFSTQGYLLALVTIVACYIVLSISRQTFAKNYFKESS